MFIVMKHDGSLAQNDIKDIKPNQGKIISHHYNNFSGSMVGNFSLLHQNEFPKSFIFFSR